MMQKVTRELLKSSSLIAAVRKNGFAAAASSDPIQKLFLDKIKEYAQKSTAAPNGLVDSNQQTAKLLEDELGRFLILLIFSLIFSYPKDNQFEDDSNRSLFYLLLSLAKPERVRNNFQIKKGEETTITSKFNDADVKYEI